MKFAIAALLLFFVTIDTGAVEWGVQTDFDGQLYPSYLISTAIMPGEEEVEGIIGDAQSFLGIWLDGAKEGDTFKVTLRKSELWDESVLSGTIPKTEEALYIAPKVNYYYDKLREVDQMRPLVAIFDLKIGEADLGTKSFTVNVRSINDCPYGLAATEDDISGEEEEPEGGEEEETTETEAGSGTEYIDLGWMFAAYVNESHPMLDKLLKAALDSGAVSSFSDYQTGDSSAVLAQIYAIWSVLHDRGIRYSNTVAVPKGSQLVYSQNVRFIEQSINNHQANCVDGSVLMASLLRKIGLSPVLVLVPGHMYLGVYLDREQEDFIGIETTVIGLEDVGSPEPIEALRSVLSEDFADLPSLVSFEAAVQIGTGDLEKNDGKYNKENPMYQLIDIEAARNDGVMPISFKKSK